MELLKGLTPDEYRSKTQRLIEIDDPELPEEPYRFVIRKAPPKVLEDLFPVIGKEDMDFKKLTPEDQIMLFQAAEKILPLCLVEPKIGDGEGEMPYQELALDHVIELFMEAITFGKIGKEETQKQESFPEDESGAIDIDIE